MLNQQHRNRLAGLLRRESLLANTAPNAIVDPRNRMPILCLVLIGSWFIASDDPASCFSQNLSASPSFSGAPGVKILMLKNGNSFEGSIVRNTQGYSIETQTGNVLIISSDQVDFIADSIEEAYWMRLAKLSATDHASHEGLFYWCVKHHLTKLAQNQLDVLRALDFSPNRRLALQNQLDTMQFAKNQPLKASPSGQLPNPPGSFDSHFPHSPSEISFPGSSSLAINNLGTSDLLDSFFDFGSTPKITSLPPLDEIIDSPEKNLIAQVGYEVPIEESQIAGQPTRISDSEKDATELTSTELGIWIKGLPPGSFLKFRQSIEPLLVANCGQCHHQSSPTITEFRLVFAGYRQPRSHLMSQRNLHNVWSMLEQQGDRDGGSEEVNSLIRYALTVHGDLKEPPIKKDSAENKRLVEWIQLTMQGLPATADVKSNPVWMPAVHRQNSATTPSVVANRSTVKTAGGNLKEIPTLNLGTSQFQPRDEFDPEIFNRGLHRPNRY